MGTDYEMNLKVQRCSRKPPAIGDIFSVELPDDSFVYGRVINPSANLGSATGILVYVFRCVSQSVRAPETDELLISNLLVAPFVTGQVLWLQGYFETIVNLPLGPGEVLDQHCFAMRNGVVYDEYGSQLPESVEALGRRSFVTRIGVDKRICDALGYPRKSV